VTMTHHIATEGAGTHPRPIGEAYLIWAAAATECAGALRRWLAATPRDGADAYCAYRAALDREEAAAHDLQHSCNGTDAM
jgi:hypothetical protein